MPSDDLADLKRTVQAHEKRISNLESLLKKKPPQPAKEISIKEFLLSKRPSSEASKTLVIAYYLERHRNTSPFTTRDLEQLYREAREPLPTNINDVVNQNIAKGFIMEAEDKKDGRKAWILTSSGERFVENGLKQAD